MTEKCIFCKIIRNDAPANVVYEDEQVIAFLSDRPVNEGHTLVVPKKHYTDIYDISEEEAAYLFKITKRVAHAVRDAFKFPGLRIVLNIGKAGGQVVFHLHAHVIPLSPRDDLHNSGVYRNTTNPTNPETLEKDAQKIRAQLCK
jgi:histidine triad (HIT) family protein